MLHVVVHARSDLNPSLSPAHHVLPPTAARSRGIRKLRHRLLLRRLRSLSSPFHRCMAPSRSHAFVHNRHLAALASSCSPAFVRYRHLSTRPVALPSSCTLPGRMLQHLRSPLAHMHLHDLALTRPHTSPLYAPPPLRVHVTRLALQQDLDGNGVVTFNEMMMTALKLDMVQKTAGALTVVEGPQGLRNSRCMLSVEGPQGLRNGPCYALKRALPLAHKGRSGYPSERNDT